MRFGITCNWLHGMAMLMLPLVVSVSLFCSDVALSADADSAKIAFYSEIGASAAEIFTMNIDGTGLQKLTTNSVIDICPAFSRDGLRIAFSSKRSGNVELYIMDRNGDNPVRLTNTAYGEYQPDWSVSDTSIVFTRYFTSVTWDYGEIYVIRADGTGERRLTNNPADDMRPTWSPDGTKIMFNSKRDGNYEIYIMNPDGSNQQRLTDTPGAEMGPRYSPDGTKISYALIDFQTFKGEIHVMNADGTGDMTLTNAGGASESVVWSPDGTKIVFQSNRTGNFDIFIMNADGSNQTNLTNSTANDYWPSWGIAIPVSVEQQSWGGIKNQFR